jgi:hypothetical protein
VEEGSVYSRVRKVGEHLFYDGLPGLLFIMATSYLFYIYLTYSYHVFI